MVYREEASNEQVRGFLSGADYFWNVSASVGYACKNMTADVFLVQFLINNYFDFEGNGRTHLVVDGLFGGKTWAGIKSCQKSYAGAVADGKISSISGDRLNTRMGGPYTILALNYAYLLKKRAYYTDLRKDPDLPYYLVRVLNGPMRSTVRMKKSRSGHDIL